LNCYFIGTIWFPWKVCAAASLIYVAFVDHSWYGGVVRRSGRLWLVVLYFVWMSVVVAYLLGPGDVSAIWGGLQGTKLRPLVQGASYTAAFSFFPLGVLATREITAARRMTGAYYVAVIGIVAIGLVQLGLTAAGKSFLPILRPTTTHVSEAASFVVGNVTLYRLYSLAGEPKTLALFLLPALFGLIASRAVGKSKEGGWWDSGWLAVPVGVVFVLTFSTAALLALALGALVLAGMLQIAGRRATRALVLIAAVVAVASVSFAGLAGSRISSRERDLSFYDVLRDRTVDRFERVASERFETQALQYVWTERRVAIPLGLGPGMYNFHIPGMGYSRGIAPIDSGWITTFLDFGLLGSAAIIAWLAGVLFESLRHGSQSFEVAALKFSAFALGGLVAAIVMHVGTGAMHVIALFAGLTWASRHWHSDSTEYA
jgi:hypothetical protein